MAEGGLIGINLSCSICFEEFKTPKMLPCGHTFCCQCLSQMVNRYSTLQCPTCRRDVFLPESGKVEDFITNFALMNLSPDQIMNKNNYKKGDGHLPKVDPLCECPQHKTPTKFYCKSCKKSVCAECLLQDHKPDTHTIATGSDMAVIFSGELQKQIEELQNYQTQEKSLGEEISKGLHCYEKDKKTVQDNINNALERTQEILKKSAESLLNEINKKAEGCTRAYRDLQEQHRNLCDLSQKIHKKCDDLSHHLKQLHLSQANELEEISKCMQTLKDANESLKTSCQSTQTKVGLSFELEEATWQLGKLSTTSTTQTTYQQPTNLPTLAQGATAQKKTVSSHTWGENCEVGQTKKKTGQRMHHNPYVSLYEENPFY